MLPPSDTPETTATLEATAAEAREAVIAADAARAWHGVPLQPWSQERQCLLDSLVAADVPLPDPGSVDNFTFYQGYFAFAVKALYLAHHEPRDWERLRGRLLSVITAWSLADAPDDPGRCNVPCDRIEDKVAAVDFVFEMINAYKKVQALRRSKRLSSSRDSGN